MYPAIEAANRDVWIDEYEKKSLTSTASPIVLCRLKEKNSYSICQDLIAPGLARIGVMLPYTPLLELIVTTFNKPLVATSANISGSPILYHDEDALELLTGIADLFVVYEREIVVPQDDSVMQFTSLNHQPIIIRRSRGLAPNYFPHTFSLYGSGLATGAELKSSFALLDGEQCYVSQFLGNQEYFEGQIAYKETLQHLSSLLKFTPDIILSDSHPGYMVSQEAAHMASEKNIPCIEIQHHKAHFAAVLAENNLMEPEESIMGIIWDGTGFGEDRQIWGSECFLFSGMEMERIAHLQYFPSWLGDKMSREPRISAVAITDNAEVHRDKFTETEWQYYRKLLRNKPEVLTSSMGRFLDGIASIIGLCHHNTYEGEATMKLEAEAMKFMNHPPESYSFSIDTVNDPQLLSGHIINWRTMAAEVLEDVDKKLHPGFIAYKVHCTMAKMVHGLADLYDVRKIAFSGGVFQNALLTDIVTRELADGHDLYFHKQLSPNDESISFGQIAYANIQQLKSTSKEQQIMNSERHNINSQPSTVNSQPSSHVFSHTR